MGPLGAAYLKLGSHDLAIAEYERALELNPNDANVLAETASALAWVGKAEEGIENVKRAMRLNPRYPDWPGTAIADTGFAEGGGALVADDATREAGEDWCQGREPWPVYHFPTGGGCRAEKLVPENLGPD